MNILKSMKKKIKQKKIILFPEPEDDRIIAAVIKLKKENIIEPKIVGDSNVANKLAKKLNLSLKNIEIIELNEKGKMADLLCKIREKKGLKKEDALKLVSNNMYYATLLLYKNKAHGIISGAAHPTGDTLRPPLQIIKTRSKIASSSMLMLTPKGDVYFFGDCGLNIKPSAADLAEIGLASAETALSFGLKPKVAFLSYSTTGSGRGEDVDKVCEAVKIAKKKNKGRYIIDGELQLDSAIVPDVAKRKAPKSLLKGRANVLIFPDLNSGNIGYKLVQRFGNVKAIGPIIQGMRKPVNDLSRGCSVEDVVQLAYITALQN